MKLARKLSILALLLVGAEASLAADEPWTAYVNSRMFDTTDPDSGVDAVKADSRELSIEANNGHFWIGRPASVYCPSGVDKLDCSIYKTNQTVFVGANDFGDGTVSLNVVVPGGQQGNYLPLHLSGDGSSGRVVNRASPHSLHRAGRRPGLHDGTLCVHAGRVRSRSLRARGSHGWAKCSARPMDFDRGF